jgi:hypothetical protein
MAREPTVIREVPEEDDDRDLRPQSAMSTSG